MKMLDIIIPAYNSSSTIEECIDSLENQKPTNNLNYSIIIVNDGSTDDTSKIIRQMKKKYDNIFSIDQHNSGVSSARNNGLRHSKGTYVTFVDADDRVSEDYISMISENINNYDWLVFDYVEINGKHPQKIYSTEKSNNLCDLYRDRLFNAVWNKVYKRELIKSSFSSDIKMGEDFLFNLEYIKNLETYKFINKPVYYYEIRQGSALRSYHREYIDNYIYLLKEATESGIFDNDIVTQRFIKAIFINTCYMFADRKYNRNTELSLIIKKLSKVPMIQTRKSYPEKVYLQLRYGRKKKAYLMIEMYSLGRKVKHLIKK